MLITSTDNDFYKNLVKLKQRKYRKRNKEYIVEGKHMVLEAYKSGHLKKLILESDEVFPLDVETIYFSSDLIKNVSSLETPVNVLGLCEMNEEKEVGNKIVILDGVQDPGNLGTIIRSAKAFNIDTIILGNNTVDLYNDKTLRATQGMHFHMNILEKDLSSFIDELKNNDYEILVTRVEHGENIKDINKDLNKFALVLGNEGNGVSEEVISKATKYIYIKMNKDVESLNVAVAGSILMYELNEKE